MGFILSARHLAQQPSGGRHGRSVVPSLPASVCSVNLASDKLSLHTAMVEQANNPQGRNPSPESERRAFTRHPAHRIAFCKETNGCVEYVWVLGRWRDISRGGICLHIHKRFEPGIMLIVDLEKPIKNSWETFRVRVQHATAQTDGDWAIGCAFSRHLSEDELRAMT